MVGLLSFDSMGTGRVLPSTEAQYGTVCVLGITILKGETRNQ